MSCDFYRRKRSYLEVGDRKNNKDEQKKVMDDKELLAYLIAQERAAEVSPSVSYDSYTSD